MNRYTLQFTYNGKEYSFALQNPQDFDSNLNPLDATVGGNYREKDSIRQR